VNIRPLTSLNPSWYRTLCGTHDHASRL